MSESKPTPLSTEKAKQAMKETLRLIKKLGSGAADLLARLRNSKTPEQMTEEMERQLAANRERRAKASERVESLHRQISARKKELTTASPARKRILEMELRGQLSEYKASERTLGILLENERTLALVRSRLEEVMAYGLSGIDEDVIDDVTEQVEEAAAEAEGRADAVGDLEKAGRRREKESGDLWEALADFDDEPPEADPEGDSTTKEFDDPEPGPETPESPSQSPTRESEP